MAGRPFGFRETWGGLAVMAAVTACPAGVQAQTPSVGDFFKTTQISMYVGSGAGGGYDTLGRLVAVYLAKHLPNRPTIIVKNMPAASGVAASNYLYNIAPRDGSAILAATNASLMLPFYDAPVAQYDPRKFEWMGSVFKQQALCVTWHTSAIKTVADAQKKEVTVGATGVSAGPGVYPKIMNAMFDTKFKVIAGYSTNTMRLAMERGEVDGVCGLAWQTYKTVSSDWIKQKKLNIMIQFGLQKHSELMDVPLALDLVKNADDRKVLELLALPQEFGRPFVAPPGVPADRMEAYRKAFQAVLKDPDFLKDLATQGGTPEPMNDKEIMALLTQAYATPKALRDRAAEFGGSM